jgi:hypothetical protein
MKNLIILIFFLILASCKKENLCKTGAFSFDIGDTKEYCIEVRNHPEYKQCSTNTGKIELPKGVYYISVKRYYPNGSNITAYADSVEIESCKELKIVR